MNVHPKPAVPPTASRSLILKVDICRGLFAFLVVAAHAYDVCWVVHWHSVNALPDGLRHLLHTTLQSGTYWVMGFFVISGYCIQLSVGRLQDAGRFPLFVYTTARLTRIMPLYYAGLVFALLVECLVASDRPDYLPNGVNYAGWISQLFIAQRPFQTFGSYAATWSISYEIFYYAIFGVLATLGSRHRAGAAWRGMVACILVAGTMQWLYTHGHKNWYTLNAGMMFGLGINWFLGALVAAHGAELVRRRVVREASRGWPLILLASAVLKGDGRCPEQVVMLVMGLAFATMLLRFAAVAEVQAISGTARPASRRVAAFAENLGLASYPTYLFHGPILLLLAAAIQRRGLISDWRITWVVLVVAGIGSGVALGWLAERPIMAWRAGILRGLKDRASSTPAAGVSLAHARRPTLTQGQGA